MGRNYHKRFASQVEKVDYLRLHPELLKLDNRKMVSALREAGLVSHKTYWLDVRPKYLKEEALKHEKG